MRNYLDSGNWNALCDSCGRKFKAFSLMKRWDGLMVCKEDYEQRHPSDFLRVQREKIAVPWSRPYPVVDTFTGYTCSVYESSAKADIATADCARVDFYPPIGTYSEETLFIYEDLAIAIAGFAKAGCSIAGKPYSLAPEV